jgi:hypothetical protein
MPPPPPPPGPPLPPPPPAGGGAAVGSKQLKLKSKAGSDTLKFDEFIKNKMDEVSVCLHVSKSGVWPVCLTTACPWHTCQESLPLTQPAVWSSMVWPVVPHAATAWPQRQLSDWHCVRSGALCSVTFSLCCAGSAPSAQGRCRCQHPCTECSIKRARTVTSARVVLQLNCRNASCMWHIHTGGVERLKTVVLVCHNPLTVTVSLRCGSRRLTFAGSRDCARATVDTAT